MKITALVPFSTETSGLKISVRGSSDKMFDNLEFGSDIYVLCRN
jgi:hypothetical protein